MRSQAATILRFARQWRTAFTSFVVALLFFNGLRASEAAAALLKDLDEQDGHQALRVRGRALRNGAAASAPAVNVEPVSAAAETAAAARAQLVELARGPVHEQAVAMNPCTSVRRPAPAAEKQNQARSISRTQGPRCSAPRASAALADPAAVALRSDARIGGPHAAA